MKLKKQLKTYGDALVISFSKEEISAHDLKKGRFLEVEIPEEKGGENNNG